MALLLALGAGGCGTGRKVQRNTENQGVERRTAGRIVDEARRWIGTPYRHGGKTRRKGTDCSGMVMEVYRTAAGVALPRNSARQQEFCRRIDRSELTPGDLVFFSSKRGGSKVSHVGIYIGDGRFIHASSSRGVMESGMDERYFATHYHSSGRVPGLPAGTSVPAAPMTSPLPETRPEPAAIPEPEPEPAAIPVREPAPVSVPEPEPTCELPVVVEIDTTAISAPVAAPDTIEVLLPAPLPAAPAPAMPATPAAPLPPLSAPTVSDSVAVSDSIRAAVINAFE